MTRNGRSPGTWNREESYITRPSAGTRPAHRLNASSFSARRMSGRFPQLSVVCSAILVWRYACPPLISAGKVWKV